MTLTPGTFLAIISDYQRRDTKKEPRECEGPLFNIGTFSRNPACVAQPS
jgi:hypothetical protein